MVASKRKKPSRTASSSESKDRLLDSAVQASATHAVLMLDRCLAAHDIDLEAHKSLVRELVKELALPYFEHEPVPPKAESSTEAPKRTSPRKRPENGNSDPHNESCEVCDLGGDLLCCDTCTLVFHKRCLRPAIVQVPKGKWSCPQCVVDGMCDGNVQEAKNSIVRMRLLSANFDYTDEIKDTSIFPSDCSIVRSNRQFVARRVLKGLIVEYGRYYELEEALTSLLQKEGADGDEEPSLWCTECLDNPSISMCAFCGCRVCYGKYDSGCLLICDGCDEETHTYCLPTPLAKIPDSAWFCAKCAENEEIVSKNNKSSSSKAGKETVAVVAGKDESDAADSAADGDALAARVVRGKGKGASSTSSHSAKSAATVEKKEKAKVNSFEKELESKLAPFEGTPEENMEQIVASGIVGMNDVISIIKKLAFRELTHQEKRCLNYFRDWALTNDIEASINILNLIRESLVKRISSEDPTYLQPNSGADTATVESAVSTLSTAASEDGLPEAKRARIGEEEIPAVVEGSSETTVEVGQSVAENTA